MRIRDTIRAALRVEIDDNTFECPIELLAANEWCPGVNRSFRLDNTVELTRATINLKGGTVRTREREGRWKFLPIAGAALIQPKHPVVAAVKQRAIHILGHVSLPELVTSNEDGRTRIVHAVFDALAELYSNQFHDIEEFSIQQWSQRVRLHGQAVSDDHGRPHGATCVDFAMLFCAVLEACGLAPLFVQAGCHAMAGCWLGKRFNSTLITDVNAISASRALVVDVTEFSRGRSFDTAVEKARELMRSGAFCYALDVSLARHRVAPLPSQSKVGPSLPSLPEHFVERPREFGRLKQSLLDPINRQPIAITTALHGAGGFGKTTLAIALCHDDEVQQAFPDGVLWVTLGQTPNLQDAVTNVYAQLKDDPAQAFHNTEEAATELARELDGQRCLLVLDDVWDPSHLDPFLRRGDSCTRLITTRDLDVALRGRPTQVDEMQTAEAAQMLAVDERISFKDSADLARLLGEWPLLLELARGALRERLALGDTPAGAVRWVRECFDSQGVTVFDRANPAHRNAAIRAGMDLSLGLLAPDERRRYQELAIFPEDTEIPLGTAATLWGLSEFRAERLLVKLGRLALIKLQLGTNKSFRLHDVVRGYLAEQLEDTTALHARLVDAWPDSYQLPDAYAWRWFAWHMVQCGRKGRLRKLLLDFGWLQAKLEAADVTSLIADCGLVRNDAGVRLVEGALRLSAHVLATDKNQLAAQLTGRLFGKASAAMKNLLRHARAWRGASWLRPLKANLESPGGPPKRLTSGHADAVRSVAVTPDGRRAISASSDQTLKVWDLDSGKVLHTLTGHTDLVTSVSVSPDGRRAISTSFKIIKVWDLESLQELRTIEAGTEWVNGLAVTPDGRHAVVGSDDKTLKVWDLDSGELIRTIAGHTDWISGVALTPDGRYVVSGSSDQTLKVWDLESGQERRTLRGHTGWVRGVAVTPDGRRIVSTSFDRTLKVWDLESGREIHTLRGHTAWIRAVAVTPDSKRAVSASYDRTLKVWDLDTGELLRTLEGHSYWARGVAVTPDGRRAISASEDRTLKVWNLDTGEEIRTLGSHAEWVKAVAVTPDGSRAVSGSSDHTVRLWDLKTGRELRILKGHASWVTGAAVTPDGNRVVSASHDRTLIVWDVKTGRVLRALQGHTKWVVGLAVTSDGRRAVSASGDQTLKLWDLDSGKEIRTLEGHSEWVAAVAVTPDGRYAVSASGDRTLKVWDLESGQVVHTLEGHSWVVGAVAVTPDGRHAVSASGDRTLRIWELGSGKELRTVRVHTSQVHSVALTSDGRRAISTSDDKTLKVWDFEKGTTIATFTADARYFVGAVAPDNRTIVAGDSAGRVHFFYLEQSGS